MVRAALKLAVTSILIASYAFLGACIRIFHSNHCLRRRELARLTSFYCRICLKLFNGHVEVEGLEYLKEAGRAPLIISNHLSYIDVILLSAVHPAVFVTSVEVRDTPFLGLMARSGGSIFVERRSKWGLLKELDEINEVLESGTPVVIFPEGTTSDGEGILPFKSALLSCARSAGTKIAPACVRYCELDGKPLNAANRDRLFYYGDVLFFPHFLGLMSMRSFRVKLRFLPTVPVQAEHGSRRRELASQIRQCILEAYA